VKGPGEVVEEKIYEEGEEESPDKLGELPARDELRKAAAGVVNGPPDGS